MYYQTSADIFILDCYSRNHSFPLIMTTFSKLTFVPGNRAGTKHPVLGGYRFFTDGRGKNSNRYYRCSLYKDSACPARITLDEAFSLLSSPPTHSHPPQHTEIKQHDTHHRLPPTPPNPSSSLLFSGDTPTSSPSSLQEVDGSLQRVISSYDTFEDGLEFLCAIEAVL